MNYDTFKAYALTKDTCILADTYDTLKIGVRMLFH